MEKPHGHVSMGGGVWLENELPVLPCTFEYIARETLLNWWRQKRRVIDMRDALLWQLKALASRAIEGTHPGVSLIAKIKVEYRCNAARSQLVSLDVYRFEVSMRKF